jgi:hypothetical protein
MFDVRPVSAVLGLPSTGQTRKYETRALQFGPAAGSVDAGRLPGRSH